MSLEKLIAQETAAKAIRNRQHEHTPSIKVQTPPIRWPAGVKCTHKTLRREAYNETVSPQKDPNGYKLHPRELDNLHEPRDVVHPLEGWYSNPGEDGEPGAIPSLPDRVRAHKLRRFCT